MKKKEEKKKPCPSQSGSFVGYQVEYQVKGENTWKPLTMKEVKIGIPLPTFFADILHIIGLKGYEQAMALAWWAKAEQKTFPFQPRCKFRIVPYDIKYSVKAFKMTGDVKLLEDK